MLLRRQLFKRFFPSFFPRKWESLPILNAPVFLLMREFQDYYWLLLIHFFRLRGLGKMGSSRLYYYGFTLLQRVLVLSGNVLRMCVKWNNPVRWDTSLLKEWCENYATPVLPSSSPPESWHSGQHHFVTMEIVPSKNALINIHYRRVSLRFRGLKNKKNERNF